MDAELLVLFRFDGPSLTLMLKSDVTFHDFKKKLAENGVPHEFITPNMTAKTEKHADCALTSEDQWRNVLFLMKVTGTSVVTITSDKFVEKVIANNPRNIIHPHQLAASTHSTALVAQTIHTASRSIISEYRNDPHIILPITDKKVLLTATWGNYIQKEGQKFEGGVIEFRVKLSKYMLEKGYKFTYSRNTDKQVVAKCASFETHGCEWYINATHSKFNGCFFIRNFNPEHCCAMDVRDSKRLSAKIIGALIVDKVKNNPVVTPNEIQDLFKGEYGLNISYKQSWRGIQKAQEYIYGHHLDSYHELKWYLLNLQKFNIGSRIEFEEGPVRDTKTGVTTNRFQQAFISFKAAIDGFMHCRPILFLDGTFLSGRYGGILLSATAKDGDNGLFPLAFAIVSSENKDNWRWFLLNLLMVIPENHKVIFVSDRNIGLMQLFQYEFPELENFYCLQHLKANLRDRLKGRALNPLEKQNVIDLFCEAARAPTLQIFDIAIEEFKRKGGKIAKDFLAGLPLKRWAFAHAPCIRFGEMTSNAAESYNNWIKDARELPITQCVDLIRTQTMELLYKRRTNAELWNGPLCGKLQKNWNAILQESRSWNICRASTYVFEFRMNPTIVVRLDEKKCDCYKWQFHGYPCEHAIAAIHMAKFDLDKYVDSYYFASTYKSSYAGSIMPVATILKLTEIDDLGERVFPPVKARQPGRPVKTRYPSKGEYVCRKRKYRCTTCKGYGHGSKKCKAPISG